MITVIGATGFTGTLITRLLDRNALAIRLAGRDPDKLGNLADTLSRRPDTAVVDIFDTEKLQRALDGSKVVINCAGPFTDRGIKVAETAIRSGVHYLDITGEQQFIRRLIEDFGVLAKQTGSTAIPACAFEYAMADAAAALAKQTIGELESFESTYVIDGMFTSRGTKKSVVRALEASSHQLENGRAIEIEGGQVSDFRLPGGRQLQRFAFPGGEVYLLPLHMPVKNVHTYLTSAAPPAVLELASKFAPSLMRTPFKNLIDAVIDMSPPAPLRHKETNFTIYCSASSREGRTTVEISGKDPYYLTAVIAGQCAMALDRDKSAEGGVISASMLNGAKFIQSITEAEGVAWNLAS